MEIRPAAAADLPTLMAIFTRARRFMAANGNPNQWSAAYPDAALMEKEIARGVCHVCVADGQVQGTFCLCFGADPTYAVIEDGAWPDDAPYAVIHRLASAGRMPGVGRACIDWCGKRAGVLRADTHADNRIMQHLLESAGFVRCGTIYTDDGSPRIAYWRGKPQTERGRSAESP